MKHSIRLRTPPPRKPPATGGGNSILHRPRAAQFTVNKGLYQFTTEAKPHLKVLAAHPALRGVYLVTMRQTSDGDKEVSGLPSWKTAQGATAAQIDNARGKTAFLRLGEYVCIVDLDKRDGKPIDRRLLPSAVLEVSAALGIEPMGAWETRGGAHMLYMLEEPCEYGKFSINGITGDILSPGEKERGVFVWDAESFLAALEEEPRLLTPEILDGIRVRKPQLKIVGKTNGKTNGSAALTDKVETLKVTREGSRNNDAYAAMCHEYRETGGTEKSAAAARAAGLPQNEVEGLQRNAAAFIEGERAKERKEADAANADLEALLGETPAPPLPKEAAKANGKPQGARAKAQARKAAKQEKSDTIQEEETARADKLSFDWKAAGMGETWKTEGGKDKAPPVSVLREYFTRAMLKVIGKRFVFRPARHSKANAAPIMLYRLATAARNELMPEGIDSPLKPYLTAAARSLAGAVMCGELPAVNKDNLLKIKEWATGAPGLYSITAQAETVCARRISEPPRGLLPLADNGLLDTENVRIVEDNPEYALNAFLPVRRAIMEPKVALLRDRLLTLEEIKKAGRGTLEGRALEALSGIGEELLREVAPSVWPILSRPFGAFYSFPLRWAFSRIFYGWTGERFLAIYGEPASGKTTAVRLISDALGRELCTEASPDLFKQAGPNAELYEALQYQPRVIWLEEAGGRYIDEGKLKDYTGGDKIPQRARYPHGQKTMRGELCAAILFVGNEPATMRPTPALMRRALPIMVTKPLQKQNPRMSALCRRSEAARGEALAAGIALANAEAILGRLGNGGMLYDALDTLGSVDLREKLEKEKAHIEKSRNIFRGEIDPIIEWLRDNTDTVDGMTPAEALEEMLTAAVITEKEKRRPEWAGRKLKTAGYKSEPKTETIGGKETKKRRYYWRG